MGRNNKTRRAAKAKARARDRARGNPSGAGGATRSGRAGGEWRAPAGDPPPVSDAEIARRLLRALASQRAGTGDDRLVLEYERRLRSLPAAPVDREAEAVLGDLVDASWSAGWQPAELHRQGRRECATASGARLVASAIAADHARRRAADLDARWIAQVDGLGLPPSDGRPGWLTGWAVREGIGRDEALAVVVDALAVLFWIPSLEPLLPAPGSGISEAGRPGVGTAGAQLDPVLERIRGLLAKAESTTFEAEAVAFTSKAQELMTRHAIDDAMLADRARGEQGELVAIRLPIDAPYADAKSLLLQTVAENGRCRSIFHADVALSTVVGFPTDVAGVEMLFTSLLLQAQTALAEAARLAPPRARARRPSYRSAFLLAYANRIDERLQEINAAVYAHVESEQGGSFLPVLRSRSAIVDAFIADRFETVSSRVRGGYDLAGWAGGSVAADNARLVAGDLT
jgi:hypothetical protein